MSNNESPSIAEESQSSQQNDTAVSKLFYRQKVWESLEANRVAIFPRPVFGRIPNFKGADKAADRILNLEEFKNAKSVEVNPDKPLEFTRIIALENEKELYVPVPRLKESLLKRLTVAGENTKYNIKRTVSRWGIEHIGTPVGIDDHVKIDLLVVGSVAVSKEGYRIGKGKGFADLEYGILKEMGAISDDTVIVTTVHDSQVFDELPKELFQKYDMPVDFILTPTETIEIERKLPRPKGIFWDVLSKRRVNLMPVLQKLKENHETEGRDTALKEEDTDIEEKEVKKGNRFRRFKRVRPRSEGQVLEEAGGDRTNSEDTREGRGVKGTEKFFRRSRSYRNSDRSASNGFSQGSENAENIPPAGEVSAKKPATAAPQRKYFRRFAIDFSLMVSNIEKNVRVRDLKGALIESGIKPNDITWRGYKGFCYLHYAKPNKKRTDQPKPFAVDNVIEILRNLKLNADGNANLSVKVMEPITRIETTDVTAV